MILERDEQTGCYGVFLRSVSGKKKGRGSAFSPPMKKRRPVGCPGTPRKRRGRTKPRGGESAQKKEEGATLKENPKKSR